MDKSPSSWQLMCRSRAGSPQCNRGNPHENSHSSRRARPKTQTLPVHTRIYIEELGTLCRLICSMFSPRSGCIFVYKYWKSIVSLAKARFARGFVVLYLTKTLVVCICMCKQSSDCDRIPSVPINFSADETARDKKLICSSLSYLCAASLLH